MCVFCFSFYSVRLVDFLMFNLLASVTSSRAVRVDLTLDLESLVNSAVWWALESLLSGCFLFLHLLHKSLSACYVPSVVLRARRNCGK